MSFTQKLLLVVALLLCLTLSAGGGWMIHANFAAAVDTALADAAADQERARTSLEDALRGTEQVKETFRAAKNWAGRRTPGADAGFSVLREDGTLVYAAMPEGTAYLDQLRAVQAGAGGAVVSAGKPPALLLAAPLQTGAAENRPQAGLWLVTAYDLSAVWAEQARQLRQFVLIELGTLAAALAAAAAGARGGLLTPGAYGASFLRAHGLLNCGIPVVKCSNLIGEGLDAAGEHGFQRVLLVGHAGKLVKLAGGIMNTHSRWADCRAELFCAHAALAGAGQPLCARLMEAATTDACLELLDSGGLRDTVLNSLLDAVQRHLERRAAGAYQVGAAMFSNQYGLLGVTKQAREILSIWNKEREFFTP